VTVVMLIPAALALDAMLGEPRRFHPLVGFGWLVLAAEGRFLRRDAYDRSQEKVARTGGS